MAAAAKALRPTIRIIGVVAEQAPAYYLSWSKLTFDSDRDGERMSGTVQNRKGAAVDTDSANTIADGLAVRRPIALNVASIRALVDEVERVSEQEMLAAIARLHFDEQVAAEPTGAAATAAWLKRGGPERTAVVLVTGMNIAPDVMQAGLKYRKSEV